jgi:hypothetical protein
VTEPAVRLVPPGTPRSMRKLDPPPPCPKESCAGQLTGKGAGLRWSRSQAKWRVYLRCTRCDHFEVRDVDMSHPPETTIR